MPPCHYRRREKPRLCSRIRGLCLPKTISDRSCPGINVVVGILQRYRSIRSDPNSGHMFRFRRIRKALRVGKKRLALGSLEIRTHRYRVCFGGTPKTNCGGLITNSCRRPIRRDGVFGRHRVVAPLPLNSRFRIAILVFFILEVERDESRCNVASSSRCR